MADIVATTSVPQISPSGLDPLQQLQAAQLQAKNAFNKSMAESGSVLVGQQKDQMAAVLNSGAYPSLDLGTNASGEPTFFIVGPANGSGQGIGLGNESITPIRDNTWSGTPLLTDSGTVITADNAAQVAAAQDAAQAAQNQIAASQATNSANDLVAAQNALAAAQARVAALQAQAANTPPNDTVTSSPDTIAASDLANTQLGQQVDPTFTTSAINTAIAQQNATTSAANQSMAVAEAAKVAATDPSNSVTDNIGGTVVGTTGYENNTNTNSPQQPSNSILRQIQNGDIVPESQSSQNNIISSPNSEDNSDNAVPTANAIPLYNDQQTTGGPNINPPTSGAFQSQNSAGDGSAIIRSGTAANKSDVASYNPPSNSSNSSTISGNKLHSYTNYSYRISIFGIPRDTINQIYSKSVYPGNESVLTNGGYFVLADSGGSSTIYDRSFFPKDLTIDNLELETIVNSSNSQTRATDVIKLKFDIIEPYTVNFLANLQQLAKALNPEPNFNWSATFFCMKIEFLGYDDSGVPSTIDGTTKYIPFTFLSIKFNVNANGAKYTCEALPANSIALTALDNVIPFHVEVKAGTIKDLFESDLMSNTTTTTGGQDRFTPSQTTTTTGTVDGANTTVTYGIKSALNKSEQEKIKPENKGQTLANTYEFEFADEIHNANIVRSDVFKDQSIAINSKDKDTIAKGKVGSLTADFTSGSFRAAAGTRITDFIGSIIEVSDYMTNQNTNSGQDSQPVKTWKITPVVKYQAVDPATNYYQRTIRYVVTPFISYGHDQPGFGQQQVPQGRITKQYDYIYSGQNKDVLETDINFSMAFFELRNGVPTQYIDGADDSSGQQQKYDAGGYDGSSDTRFFKPRYHYARGLAHRQNTGPTTVSGKAVAVQNLMEYLFNNRGDMISLDITIVGDPDWISQDYAIMHPSVLGSDSYHKNGSVNFSGGPVYFNFYFATPSTDYDDSTGMFNVGGNYSEFSGTYQVVSVKSSFSGGKFTQKLQNFRVRNQDPPKSGNSRSDTISNGAPTQTINAATQGITEGAPAGTADNIVNTSNQQNTAGASNSPPAVTQNSGGISEDAAPTTQGIIP